MPDSQSHKNETVLSECKHAQNFKVADDKDVEEDEELWEAKREIYILVFHFLFPSFQSSSYKLWEMKRKGKKKIKPIERNEEMKKEKIR